MKFNRGNWNLWRILRFVAGTFFAAYGLYKADYVLAAAGAFLLVHTYINACAACQTTNCEIPVNKEHGKF